MATHPVDASAPLDVLLATIPSLPRPVLSRLTARMIERLDEMDGDPDAEEDNEDCGQDEGEPDFRRRRRYRRNESGPGCTISDPDFGADDLGEAATRPEPWGDFGPIRLKNHLREAST